MAQPPAPSRSSPGERSSSPEANLAEPHLDGTFKFPVTGGQYDTATRDGEITTQGTVRFRGHETSAGSGNYLLFVTITNPRIVLDGDAGTLYADATSKNLSTGAVDSYPNVDLASRGADRQRGARVRRLLHGRDRAGPGHDRRHPGADRRATRRADRPEHRPGFGRRRRDPGDQGDRPRRHHGEPVRQRPVHGHAGGERDRC
jgi:hypothetical protein